MGQYINISTPAGTRYEKNIAIEEILVFFGKQYKKSHRGIFAQRMRDYKAGLYYIDKECGYLHKRAIRNLKESKKITNTTDKVEYQQFKFHKKKAENFFLIMRQRLEQMKAPGNIWKLFNQLYADIIARGFVIEDKGSNIVSYLYRTELNHAKDDPCNDYSKEEKDAIGSIISAIEAYDDIYRK